jgi:hypothetical protein
MSKELESKMSGMYKVRAPPGTGRIVQVVCMWATVCWGGPRRGHRS